jgi:hypothetical protein
VKEAIHRATRPILLILVLAAVAGAAVWILRRGRRAGFQAATEACCPVCLALGAIAPAAFALREMEPLVTRYVDDSGDEQPEDPDAAGRPADPDAG